MNKHTPGPWKDGPVFNQEGRAIFWTDESKPGKWQRRVDNKTGIFTEADAKLIAAAPELLAALQFIVNDAPTPGEDAVLPVDGYNLACAAIVKATS